MAKNEEKQKQAIDWGQVSIQEIKCPGCSQAGQVMRYGYRWSKGRRQQRFQCDSCGALFLEDKVEGQVLVAEPEVEFDITTLPAETAAKVNALTTIIIENPGWGNIRLRRALKEQLGSGLSNTAIVKYKHLIKGGYLGKPTKEPEVEFDITKLTEDQQAKVKCLIEIATKQPGWGSIKLQKELKHKMGSGLSKSLVVKVKNLVHSH